MMVHGKVFIPRSVMLEPIWKTNERYDKRSAFIEIFFNAAFKENQLIVNNDVITIKKGQYITSEVKLAERWKWSRTAVRNYLKLLEKCGIIKKIVYPNKFIIIELLNYDGEQSIYSEVATELNDKNDVEDTLEATEEQQKNNIKTTDEQQKNTNNKVLNNVQKCKKKRNKNIDRQAPMKNSYGEFVKLSENEHTSLINKYGEQKTKRMIEVLDNYKGSSGKSYASDYRAILSWVVNAYEQDEGRKNNYDSKKEKQNNEINKGEGPSEETIRIENIAREKGLIGDGKVRDIQCDF